MIRFLVAVARAIAQLAADIGSAFAEGLTAALDAIKRLFGGGGGPAAPVQDIIAALPDVDKITDKIAELKIEQAAEAYVADNSPAMQARLYALEPAETRHQRDLDLLSSDQRLWLRDLTDDQLMTLGAAKDRQIEDALAGMPLALGSVMSVGYRAPEMVAPTFARRLTIARSTMREIDHVPAL